MPSRSIALSGVATLAQLAAAGLPMAVVRNSGFSSEALKRHLEEHRRARFFRFVMSSADYVTHSTPSPHATVPTWPSLVHLDAESTGGL